MRHLTPGFLDSDLLFHTHTNMGEGVEENNKNFGGGSEKNPFYPHLARKIDH